MSVLIKGMKKPDNCEICPSAFCNLDIRNCPIVEIPDHGDLIDKDALIDVLYHGSKNISEIQRSVKDEKTISYCQGIMVGYANSRIALHVAPVVIPAERSEDE